MRYSLILASLLFALSASAATNAIVVWNASPDATVTGYRIYVGTASRSYTFVTNSVASNVTTNTVNNLNYGVTYYFTATAFNPTTESDYCNEVSYLVPYPKPAPPSLLRRIARLFYKEPEVNYVYLDLGT